MFEEGKTAYSLIDEHGDKSTITVEKWAADLLQEMLPDVHKWVQEKYSLICEKKPHLSRRKKGDVVRMLAYREAEKNPRYIEFVRDL
jgi:hypothetical protein